MLDILINEVNRLDFLTSSTHFHIFTWAAGIILFLVAAVQAKDSKGKKITHMTARLFYVLIVLSGVFLFFTKSGMDPALYGVKFLLGLVTIGLMEMVLVRSQKGKNVKVLWLLFILSVIGTIALGFYL